MRSHLGGLRRAFKENHLITTQMRSKKTNSEKEANVIEWCTLFRRNWHIYVDMILMVKLKPFQTFMLWLMGVSNTFFAICSRGLSKSWLVALGGIVKMLLFPYTHVVITSSTVAQANKLVEKKIRDELIKKLSPYLLYLYEKDWIIIKKADEGYTIECTLNGSDLIVVPCAESARGLRATWIVYEECRLLKKGMIDSVFEKMMQPRQAKFLENPVYAKNKRWQEEGQSIYITSARFKFEWFWNTFKDCVNGYYRDKKANYGVFAGDIFLAIDNGLKTWGDYRKAIKMSGEMDFRMEDLNEMIGESEDAFFTIQSFKDNQIISKAFTPPTPIDIYMRTDLGNKPKEKDEIRLIIVDYAFANTTSREKNDNTIIMCMSLHWKKNRFERHVDYIEGWSAGDSIGANNRARELWWDYSADYLIPDTRAGGEVLYNRMTEPWEHPERGGNWNSHGFTVCDKMQYHVVPEAKLKDLKARTVDPNAVPCIIPMISTGDINSVSWVELKKQLECGTVKFLTSMQDKQEAIEDDGTYFKMTSDELAKTLAPHMQVDLLIQEAINLKTEFRNDKIKLVEPRSGTKDRAVVLAYGNYIASLIENEWNKQAQVEDDSVEWDEVPLVW